jgi:hypothetical protein
VEYSAFDPAKTDKATLTFHQQSSPQTESEFLNSLLYLLRVDLQQWQTDWYIVIMMQLTCS